MVELPVFDFQYDPSVADFAVSKDAYLAARPDVPFSLVATGAIVLDTTSPSGPRVLLLKRAASDSRPNKWEPPGGACDDEDVSILHAAARELAEEAGLKAARIGGPIGEARLFSTRRGSTVCQFYFAAYVESDKGSTPTVKLDPEEHQQFVWATEDEVKAMKVDSIDLDFTTPEVHQTVLDAFEFSRKESKLPDSK